MPESTRSQFVAARSLFLLLTVFAFFFISGGSGLLYQVVWTRKLVLLFGTAAYAVSTVLSIFFLGLALGSWWGGRLADRTRRHLLLYGIFELVIGAWAVFFLVAVGGGESLVVALLQLVSGSRTLGILLRAAMAGALMFPPVFLMGATLPLLAKFVNREGVVLGRRVGTLYAVNTFGAVAGCYLAGFHLLPMLGYIQTTLVGAAANGVVGVGACLLALRVTTSRSGGPEAFDAAALDAIPVPGRQVRAVVGGYALVGFAMLALEVVWTRLLVIVFLGTTYAYSTMLTTLLCGIAAGSFMAAWAVDRVRRHVALYGSTVLLLGIACVFTLGWIADLPGELAAARDWEAQIESKFGLAFRVLFVPTFLSGMAFPLAVKALAPLRAHLGRGVGRLYAANTVGGVLGAVLGGFVLLPWLGAHDTILLLGALLIAAGAFILRAAPDLTTRGKWAVAGLVFLPLLLLAWNGAPADVSRALNTSYVPADHTVIYFDEGVEGTVAVSEPTEAATGSDRVLWINRVQATVSIEKGVKMNRLQGVLPLLYEQDPRSVLFMCFGSGITAGTLALHDFDRIDAVEIAPEVLAATHLFEKDNLGVAQRPNIRFHVDDGRNFLLRTRSRYDVITFEPMPLALAGVSTFYTRNYYQLCHDRLNAGGLVSQWVPLHSLSPPLVRGLVRTFTEVFPYCHGWFVNADLFLIGSNAPLRIDVEAAQRRLSRPPFKNALAGAGLCDVTEVLASFLMDKAALTAFAGDGPIMTDDRPWAEFEAPKLVEHNTVPEAIAAIAPHVQSPTAALAPGSATAAEQEALHRRHQAHRNDLDALKQYYSGMTIDTAAAEAFLASLDIDPGDCNARYYLRELIAAQAPVFLRWGEAEQVARLLGRAASYLDDYAPLHLYLGDALYIQKDYAEAARHYGRYLELGGTAQRARARAKSRGETTH
ncbi:MAG: fused MFS/spermidine synthase [Candidatus Hydrogenedentota bacterium]